jgi:PAS domain S-box-containing protein
MNEANDLCNSGPFMPHGHCYFWSKDLIALHAVSDALIAAAYYSIPFTLFYFVRRRRDLAFHWMFICFAVFILACGTTHLIEIWNIWHADYWLAGGVKALTALASVPTAALLIKLVPTALSLPSADALQKSRDELELRVAERTGQLAEANATLTREARERQRAEQEALDSEKRLRAVLDAAPNAVVVIDRTERILDWNAQAEKMFGWSRAEILGRTLHEAVIPPRYRAAHQRGLERYLATGGEMALNRVIDLNALRRNGDEFPVELSISPLQTGDTITFCGFITDLTERKQAADQLQASLKDVNDLKTALDEHAIVAITDPRGRITYVNDKFCAISKYSREELLGQDHRIINSGHHPKEFIRGLWTTIAQGQVWKGEIRNRAKDGSTYWVDTTIVPFLKPDGKPYQYVAIRADITARKQVEEEFRRLNHELEARVTDRTAQLEAANKELEAFSYSVSHDLRAPLRHIDGFVGLLIKSDEQNVSARGRSHLHTISDSAKQMGQLIDDLLVFARMGRAEMRINRVDLSHLLEEVLHSLRPEFQNRNIIWHKQPLPVVHADHAMLRQVLVNLLANAIKYTRPRDPAVIEIGCRKDRPGESVVFVRDNGVGFDTAYADNLFGVFQRLHRAEEFEGTGIGLANVRRIIIRHGGRTWAESQPGAGATFYFSLPEPPGSPTL